MVIHCNIMREIKEKHILVVLDVNGILAKKNKKKKWFILEDEVKEFISKIQEKYDVAIWSSTTRNNAKIVVSKIFTKKEPIFEWYREDICIPDPERTRENFYETIKNISIVEERFPDYEKIIIIDDEHKKVRFNPFEQIIVPKIEFKKEDYNNLINKIDEKILDQKVSS